MAKKNIDVTNKIERLEAFEERLRVSLDSLSAFIEDESPDYIHLTIRGELQARDGTELSADVDLVVAAYDMTGRIVGTSTDYIISKNFFGLETFDITVSLPMSQISKVRVYPKKG